MHFLLVFLMNKYFPWSKAMHGLIVEKDLGDTWPSGPQNQMPAIPMWMPGVDSGSVGHTDLKAYV